MDKCDYGEKMFLDDLDDDPKKGVHYPIRPIKSKLLDKLTG